MKKILFCFLSIVNIITGLAQTDVNKGPINIKPGVIDGIVVQDEIPTKTKIPYEHVRAADLVWSKRVFSRIDAREKMNHDIFLPYEKYLGLFTMEPPKTLDEAMNHKGWVRNQERLSLWTIILQHLMNGDLTMYFVADTNDVSFEREDGYNFKYPLEKIYDNNGNAFRDSYFHPTQGSYRKEINKRIGVNKEAEELQIDFQGALTTMTTKPGYGTFQSWIDYMISQDYDVNNVGAQWKSALEDRRGDKDLEKAWKKAMADPNSSNQEIALMIEAKTVYLGSEMITAYNIKEDWYFDKERSILDRRIIAIAPVAKFVYDDKKEKVSGRKGMVVRDPFSGGFISADCITQATLSMGPTTQFIELPIFWLYFPELRNVITNYFVFNDQNDSQWMSFDDLFWKRRFTSKIYKVSDKFDREIQDYKYGVDALYEAERLKEKIRNWEINVWNY